MRAAILCLLLSAVAISADLQSDFEDLYRHVPMDQLELIGQKYVAIYPEIRPTLLQWQGINYEDIVKNVVKHKEVHDLVEYFNRHGIDAEKIMFDAVYMMKLLHVKWLEPQSPGQLKSALPEITGDFLHDFYKALWSEDLQKAVQEKMETSPDFVNYANAVRDPEFKSLFFRIMNSHVHSNKHSEPRGFFSKVWKKIKDIGFGVGVSIPIGK